MSGTHIRGKKYAKLVEMADAVRAGVKPTALDTPIFSASHAASHAALFTTSNIDCSGSFLRHFLTLPHLSLLPRMSAPACLSWQPHYSVVKFLSEQFTTSPEVPLIVHN